MTPSPKGPRRVCQCASSATLMAGWAGQPPGPVSAGRARATSESSLQSLVPCNHDSNGVHNGPGGTGHAPGTFRRLGWAAPVSAGRARAASESSLQSNGLAGPPACTFFRSPGDGPAYYVLRVVL